MASRQEIHSSELDGIPQAILSHLASTIENSSLHPNDNLAKPAHSRGSVEDKFKKEKNNTIFFTTRKKSQQSCKPMATTKTDLKDAIAGEKENMELCPTKTRFGLISSRTGPHKAQVRQSKALNQNESMGRLLNVKDWKKQLKISSKIFSQRGVNLLDKATGRLQESSDTVVSEYVNGPAEVSLARLRSSLANTKLKQPLQENVCGEDCCQISMPQHRTNFLKESASGGSTQSFELVNVAIPSTESMKAPLLSPLANRSDTNDLCSQQRSDNRCLRTQLHNSCEKRRQSSDSALEIRCVESCSHSLSVPSRSGHLHDQDAGTSMDHIVVFFSAQNFLQEQRFRVNKQTLQKIFSLCSVYSRKFLHCVKALCRQLNIKFSMLYTQKAFTSSRRPFVKLDSHEVAEKSAKGSSFSVKKELAKNHELKAVLLKINEVLVSMDRASTAMRLDRNHSEA